MHMDCLRSFKVTVSGNQNTTAPEAKFWGLAPQNYWSIETGFATTSIFNVEGFKNIDVYKIVAVGNVNSENSTSTKVLVQDFNWFVRIGGQMNILGGNITVSPNKFNMTLDNNNPVFSLAKYYPTIEFAEPVNSVKYFEVLGLQANGIGAENLTTINLSYNVSFIIYYQFEGEELAFL